MNDRLKTLQNTIVKERLGSFLVSKPENIAYLTGYSKNSVSDNSAYLLIKPRSSVLIHSTLSQLHQKKGLKQAVFSNKSSLSKTIKKGSSEILTVESDHLTSQQSRFLKKSLKPIKINTSKKKIVAKLRKIKDYTEISSIKKACQIATKTMLWIKPQLVPGNTEKQINHLIHQKLLKLGADDIAFPVIVATGSHSAIPHHISTNKKIKTNDTILIDFGCSVNDYHSDITRTFFVGKTSPLQEKVKHAVHLAYNKAIPFYKAGFCKKVDIAVRSTLAKSGFEKYFPHGSGHGIGLEVHELPPLNSKSKEFIEPNMTLTLEPGVYLPRKFGYRYENTILTTKKSPVTLTQ